MPRTYNRWIFTKSCEFRSGGNLNLGQILAEPKDPASVLQPLGPLPMHEGMVVEVTSRENVRLNDNNEFSAHFCLWANLGYFPARLSSSVVASQSHEYTWHFSRLESRLISPTIAYVEEAMRHGDVPATLSDCMFKRRVYMVTGVRLVSGAQMKRRDESSVSISSSEKGAPPVQSVSAGLGGKMATNSLKSEEFDTATDFIFAYRLNEVKYRGKVRHKPYAGGETESSGQPQEPRGSEIEIHDFEVLKLSDIPWAGEAHDFKQTTIPGYNDVECFVPKQ